MHWKQYGKGRSWSGIGRAAPVLRERSLHPLHLAAAEDHRGEAARDDRLRVRAAASTVVAVDLWRRSALALMVREAFPDSEVDRGIGLVESPRSVLIERNGSNAVISQTVG
jgi:hypothetical protein